MAIRPNILNPSTTIDNPAPTPEDRGGNWGAISDSLGAGFYGQLRDAIQRDIASFSPATVDFDYRQHIPEGYEGFADAFRGAANAGEIALRKRQIDDNIGRRRRRDARGGWSTFGTDALTAVFDPINLFGAPVRGAGLLAGAARGALVLGAPGALQEVARVAMDATATREEGAFSAAAALGFGAVIGGGVGLVPKPGARPTPGAAIPRSTIRQHEIIRHVLIDLEGGSRVVDNQDGGGTTKYGITQTNNRDLDVASLTFDQAAARARSKYWLPEMDRAEGGIAAVAFDAYYISGNRQLVKRILAAPSRDEALSIYRAHLNRLADTNPAKARFKRGWNNRLDKLGRFVGAEGRSPAAARNAVEGYSLPSEIATPDGRGIPVVVGKTGSRSPARFVRAKTADEIEGEVALEAAQQAAAEANAKASMAAETSIWDGLDEIHHSDVPKVAAAWARRAEQDEAFRASLQLGHAPTVADIGAALAAERKRQLIAKTQAAVDAGDPRFQPKPASEPAPVTDLPRRRQQLQRHIAALAKRADGLERLMKERGDNARVPEGTRRPTGEEIAAGTFGENDTVPTGWTTAAQLVDQLEERIGALQTELDELGGAVDPDLEAGQLFGTGLRLADEGDAQVAARLEGVEDEALRELAAADARKREADFDSGELADELPFGMEEAGEHYGTRDGDHFVIDVEAVLNSFADRPWTDPRVEGVRAYPEEAFRDPAEWLDFVVEHEVEHSFNPRRGDETLADYENRINDAAYARVTAKRSPNSPEGNRLQRLAYAGTPIAQLESLVPDKEALIHQSLLELGSDMAMQSVGNRLGRPTVRNGSVLQRAARWSAKLFEIRDATRRAYLDEIGMESGGTRLQVEASVLAQRIPGMGRLTGRKRYADFKQDVAAAQVGFSGMLNGRLIEPSEAAKRAAAVLNRIAQEVEADARALGLFRGTKALNRALESAERSRAGLAARRERMAERGLATDEIDRLLADADARLENLRERAARPIMQPGEERYYHRIYDQRALREGRDRAIEALTRAYARQGHEHPSLAARGAYDNLLMDPTGESRAPGVARGLHELELPWTNAEAFEFLVTDPELTFGVYLRRMGAQIEMARSFGDAYGLDHLDQLRADLAERGVAGDDINQAIQLWTDVRDRIVGGLHGKDPLSWDNRVARSLKSLANLAVLGKSIYTQMTDIARFIGTQGLGLNRLITGKGPAGLIGGLAGAFVGDVSKFTPGGNAKLAGEALELVNGRLISMMIEADDAILVTRDTFFERGLQRLQVPFFVANLMTPFTVALKEMTGLVAAHNLIDEAQQVARALQAGTEPDPQLVARLAQMGLDTGDAQILASMPIEKGDSGLYLANVLAWEGERGQLMRDKFLAAIHGEIRRTVITPGPLDRPRVFDGIFYSKSGHEAGLERIEQAKAAYEQARREGADNLGELKAAWDQARRDLGRAGRREAPLASLPFQLHSFAMASGAKMLHGLLTRGERNRVGGIIALMLSGMLVTWLKQTDPLGGLTTSDADNKRQQAGWDKMSWGEFLSRSFEASNLGIWFTDVAKNLDTLGLDVPLVDNEFDPDGESVKDEVGATLGVAPGLIAGLVEPFITNDPADSKAAAVRRVVPMNNLVWWKGVVDQLEDWAKGPGEDEQGLSARPRSRPQARSAAPSGAAPAAPDRTFVDGEQSVIPMSDRRGGAFFAPDPSAMLIDQTVRPEVARPELAPDLGPIPEPLPPRKRPRKGRRGPRASKAYSLPY